MIIKDLINFFVFFLHVFFFPFLPLFQLLWIRFFFFLSFSFLFHTQYWVNWDENLTGPLLIIWCFEYGFLWMKTPFWEFGVHMDSTWISISCLTQYWSVFYLNMIFKKFNHLLNSKTHHIKYLYPTPPFENPQNHNWFRKSQNSTGLTSFSLHKTQFKHQCNTHIYFLNFHRRWSVLNDILKKLNDSHIQKIHEIVLSPLFIVKKYLIIIM